jgi:hypothetical protein
MLCGSYLSIIRPYIYSLQFENTSKSERFIVDTLHDIQSIINTFQSYYLC